MTFTDILSRVADRIAKERFDITRSWSKTPYLSRWCLRGMIGGNEPAIFLHRFLRSDADELHDHPWPFTSVILLGGYYEITQAPGWKNGEGPTRRVWCSPGRILRRPANWIRRVEIPEGREAWTLIFHGEKVRSWGFWCPSIGWRPWREHLATAELNNGSGCA